MTAGTAFAPIVTGRLVLRALVPADAEAVFAYRSDAAVSRYQGWVPSSADEVRSFIEASSARAPGAPGGWFQIGIALRATGQLVGDCGISVAGSDPRQAEVGITLAPPFQGRGLATEALHAVLGYAFSGLAIHRVHASVDPRNQASLALLERAGMRREAHHVRSLWFKGEWADDVVFALLEDEWAPLREAGADPAR